MKHARLALGDVLLAVVLTAAAAVLLALAWIGWTGRHSPEPVRFVGVPSRDLIDEYAPGPFPIAPPVVVLIETPHETVRFDGFVVVR